jgi:hypothetical protein
MEIYIPYVVGSTAIGILSKGVFNYMYKDNSDIMNLEIIDNDSDIKKDYFDIETIENTKEETKEEPIENSKEEPIEESKKIESKEEPIEIESAYRMKNKKIKCSGCKNYLKLSSYSKTQNKLGDRRKCKVCIKLSY